MKSTNSFDDKLCVVLGGLSFEECRTALSENKLCELRLDLLSVDDRLNNLLGDRTKINAKTVVTYRATEKADNIKRAAALSKACELGATYVDIDLPETALFQELLGYAKECGTKVILSHHDFKSTPPASTLREIADRCFTSGADVAKVACAVTKNGDAAALLSLLSDPRPHIVVGIGDLGIFTRIAAPLLGSLFSYVTPAGGEGTAPGQISLLEMEEILSLLDRYGVPRGHLK